ncbi:MAG: hypothetical protein K2I20_03715, partial [Clostridia bacterium]|nr:hypothetical protein [Clostridia bacterium]
VEAVSYNVFNTLGVTDVHLNSADVKFTDEDKLSHFGGGDFKIHADRENVEALRKTFYGMNKVSFKAFELANSVVPNVDAGEVYVTFAYNKETYATANGKVLPVWIGNKGETFKLSDYAQEYPYVKYSSASNEGGLYSSYSNFGGKVLKELKYFDAANVAGGGLISGLENEGNTVLDGAKIADCYTVDVGFENVYRIKVQNDNDLKYEPSVKFKSFESTGYRYATGETFDGVLNEIKTSRQGFTLAYNYGITPTMEAKTYHGFESDIARANFANNTVYMYPVWSLNAPTIKDITTSASGGNIVYGEDIKVTANAASPAYGIQLSYEWTRQTETSFEGVASAASFVIEKIKLNQGGNYGVSVKAYGENTSLTSFADASVEINVLKRPVYLDWTGTEAVTYNGAEHSISFEVRARQAGSGLLDEDGVSVSIYSHNSFPVNIGANSATFKNAGTYTLGGRFGNGAAVDNYYIVDSTASVQKVINKAPLDLAWNGTTQFVYNKKAQAPEPTVAGGIGSDDTKVTVNGAEVHSNYYSGNQSYIATAVTSNGNYYIRSGNTCPFTIAQKEVEVEWLTNTLTYTGSEMAPLVKLSASNTDVIEGDVIQLDRAGFQTYTNAYTGISEYVATATFGHRDYKATAATATRTFKILPKSVSFVWESTTSFEYNGAVQYPKVAEISGAYSGDINALKAALNYSGGGKDVAGGAYSVYANSTAKIFSNYVVEETSRMSGYYTITPKIIQGSYTSSQTELPYMGSEMKPTFSYSGVLEGDNIDIIQSGAGENVGTYKISATSGNPNYQIECEPFTYRITPAPVIIEWGSAALIYNGQVHSPKATTKSTIYPRDDMEIVCTYDKADAMRKNVGSFVATATLVSKIEGRPASNYEIISGAKQEFFVNHVQLEIRVKNVNFVYDGTAQLPEVEIVNKSAIVAGENLELVVTGSATEAGTYTATVKLKNNNSEPAKNYKLKYENQFNNEITVTFYITAPAEPETQSVSFAEGGKRYYCAAPAEGGSL